MVVVEGSQVEHVGIAGVHRDGAQPLGKRSLEHPAGVVRSSETKAAHDQIPRVALPGANVVRTSEVVDGSNGRKVAFVQLAPPVTLPIRVEGWNRGLSFPCGHASGFRAARPTPRMPGGLERRERRRLRAVLRG